MAEPKKRTNKTKTNMRRMHDKVAGVSTGFCPKCFEPVKTHTVCYNCGTYKSTQVLENKKEK